MKKFFLVSFLMLSVLIFPSGARAEEDTNERLIIKFRSNVSSVLEEQILRRIEAKEKQELPRLARTMAVRLSRQNAEETLNTLAEDSSVEYAEIDHIARSAEFPNDPAFSQEWGLLTIQAPSAWNTTKGNEKTTIAIVDSGINGNHPDLTGKITERVNFTTETDTDTNGHGTHVAGIAGANTNNGVGVAGVAYNDKLLSVKVLDRNGTGYYSWIANGIAWAADHGAKVINLSLGGPYESKTLSDAITYATNKGAVIVAAAGNSGTSSPQYPAYYSGVIAVGATDSNDQKPWFSNYGSWVDIAAPGVSIYSTYANRYARLSGTSMATAFVSGVAGLVWAAHPDWTNNQIRQKILDGVDFVSGGRRINACKAVDCLLIDYTRTNPTPTPTPNLPKPTTVSLRFLPSWSNNTSKGKIDMTISVALGTISSTDIQLIVVGDGIGIWGIERPSMTRVYTKQGRAIVSPLWEEQSARAIFDFSKLSKPLESGSTIDIHHLQLVNDTQGAHAITLIMLDHGTEIARQNISFDF